MKLEDYQLKKQALREEQGSKVFRIICGKCRKDTSTCYCAHIKPFNAGPIFVILIHPKEQRKRIGTGRLTHLCLKNSELIEGVDFSENEKVNSFINNNHYWPMVLYPGEEAFDLSKEEVKTIDQMIPTDKTLVIFVIDGTWPLSKKILRLSTNLSNLPKIQFTPPKKSNYRIRKQPMEICFSTIEAVHYIIERLNPCKRWQVDGDYGNLLQCFDLMIDQQLTFIRKPRQKAIRGNRTRARNKLRAES